MWAISVVSLEARHVRSGWLRQFFAAPGAAQRAARKLFQAQAASIIASEFLQEFL
jgi:hypothetical protein